MIQNSITKATDTLKNEIKLLKNEMAKYARKLKFHKRET